MMPFLRHYPTTGSKGLLVCAFLLAWMGTADAEVLPANARSVGDDLLMARGFCLGECYAEAFECDEAVLAFDLHNTAARAGEARIRLALLKRGRAKEWRHLYLPSLNGPIYRKLRGITLPEVDFQATPLADAVEFLRRETVRRDTDPNFSTRGVNVILPPAPHLPTEPTPAPAPPLYSNLDPSTGEAVPGLPVPVPVEPPSPMFPDNPRLTLQIGRTSLLNAWQYLAAQGGRRLDVREDGIYLPWDIESIGVIPSVTFHLAPGRTLPRDLRPWFEARGVTFTPSARVTRLPLARGFVVYGPWIDVEAVAVFFGRHADAFQ